MHHERRSKKLNSQKNGDSVNCLFSIRNKPTFLEEIIAAAAESGKSTFLDSQYTEKSATVLWGLNDILRDMIKEAEEVLEEKEANLKRERG